VLVKIVGTGLPGSTFPLSGDGPDVQANVHVGVQGRGKPAELLGVVPADAAEVTWTLAATVTPAPDAGPADIKGPYIQGPPGGRFIYLSWGAVDSAGTFAVFRRAKLWLNVIPPQVLEHAVAHGVLVGRLGLSDSAGGPLCASVRPPRIEWLAAGE
jgi:Family of unknown function (DUF5990)